MSVRRRAFTLVEAAIAVAIGSVVIITLYMLFGRGLTSQDATAKGIDVMVQARLTMEHLTRDVHQALVFLPPEGGDGAQVLVIIQNLEGRSVNRLELNRAGQSAYPFFEGAQGTKQLIPAVRVRYVYRPDQGTLDRLEDWGVLECATEPRSALVSRWQFQPGQGEQPPLRLAKDVAPGGFHFRLIGLTKENQPRPVEELRPEDFGQQSIPGDERVFKAAQAVMVFVRLKIRFARGLYGKDPQNPQPGKDRPAEEVELVTKILSSKRLADVRDREWFSSADEDLRF